MPFGRGAQGELFRQTKRPGTRALGVPAGTQPHLACPDGTKAPFGRGRSLRARLLKVKAAARPWKDRCSDKAWPQSAALVHAFRGTAMRRAQRRLLPAAAALSLTLHAALLAGLWLDPPSPPPPPAPVVELTLVRPTPPAPSSATAPATPAPPGYPDEDLEIAAAPVARSSETVARSRPRLPPGATGQAAPSGQGATGIGVAPEPGPPGPPATRPPERIRPRLGEVLRADTCSDADRLTARERDACRERLGRARAAGPIPPTAELRRALEAADDRRAKANRRLGETFDDPHVAQCAGSGLCRRELAGVPFGEPPPALPVIPPSTLRGDDDALRLRPRP